MDKKVLANFNAHLQKEMFSSYLYLAMAAYFETEGYKGIAKWMELQSREEYGHGMKFYHHILERGGVVDLQTLQAPTAKWKNIKAAFESALKHEEAVTKAIHTLATNALKSNDHVSYQFLGWFVTEQVEEETTFRDILSRLKLIGENPAGLIMLDKDLASRIGG